MMHAQFQRIERVYTWFLQLYPAPFRQEFGEEMHFIFTEQLRDAAARHGTPGVALLWGRTLLDLGKSLAHEHWAVWKGKQQMNMLQFAKLGFAALMGLLLVLPLIALEAIMTSGFERYGFPLFLFTLLWIFAALFVLILAPMVRSVRAGSITAANPAILLFRVLVLALLAWAWISLVVDQMPCFLGIPNCD
jgi:hypothetical protein